VNGSLKIVVFGTDAKSRNRYIVKAVADAFASDSSVASVIISDYGNLVRDCQEQNIDILLAIGGAGGNLEILRRASDSVNTSILWTSEDPYELERNIAIAELFDASFTNDINAAASYPNGTHHLPFAAASRLHNFETLDASNALFDLFFVGTAWPERVDTLNEILIRLPRSYRLKIGLSGNRHLPNFHLGSLDLITDFRLSPREFAKFANNSLVALTLDRSFSSSTQLHSITGGTPPPRLFELALAGTAQVYVTSRGEEAAKYFTPDQEILLVSSLAEAVEATASLVEDPERRTRIAKAARQRALNEHCYEHRVSNILRIAQECAPKRRRHRRTDRKRVLFVTHNMAGIAPYGGVELYQQTIAEGLGSFDFYFLYPSRSQSELILSDADQKVVARFPCPPIAPDTISDSLRETIFQQLLIEYRIDLVHYNHLLGHPLSFPIISSSFGVPAVFQAHDYYGLCREFNLIGIGGRYCKVRDERTDVCDVCLSSRGIAPPGSQARRRLAMSAAFQRVDAFLHNVEYTRNKFAQIFPDLDMSKHHVVGMTANGKLLAKLEHTKMENLSVHPGKESRLQVVVLGNFTVEKGAELLISMFWQFSTDRIDFHVIGRIDERLDEGLKQFENVHTVGTYTQSSLPGLLQGKQVSIHFSIWPETYCIGLDEARAAGLVPIVLGHGALKERVTDEVDGLVVDPTHPFDLIRKLRRLASDLPQLDRFRAKTVSGIEKHKRHLDSVEKIYLKLLSIPKFSTAINTIWRSPTLNAQDSGTRFNSPNWKLGSISYDDTVTTTNRFNFPNAHGSEARRFSSVSLSEMSVEPELWPGDQSILLTIDECVGSIERSRTVLVPKHIPDSIFAVGVPRGLDRLPTEVVLIGKHAYRSTFNMHSFGDDGRKWTGAAIGLGDIEPGTYRVAVGFLVGDAFRRYGSGMLVALGDKNPEILSPDYCKSKPWSYGRDLNGLKSQSRSGHGLRHTVSSMIFRIASGANAHIDTVNGRPLVDGQPQQLFFSRENIIRIEGWIVPRNTRDLPFEMAIVRLVGARSTHTSYAEMKLREDVAKHFRNPKLVRSGLSWETGIAGLKPGNYRLEAIGIDRFGRKHVATLFGVDLNE
jgi:glycosyltransferase involved in cell wall biosynthesis/spore maturation protein CgeB